MRKNLLSLFVSVMLVPAFSFAESPRKLVTASATEDVSIEATIVKAVVAVQESASTAKEAGRKAAEKADAVMTWLKKSKVSKLKTQGLSLSPQYKYDGGSSKIIGYQAQHTISFEIAVAEAGAVLDTVIENGASRIDSVMFSAADSELDAARLKAIEKATLSAKQQAEEALKALALQAKGFSEISVNTAGQSIPIPHYSTFRVSAMEDSAKSTPIEGGELKISATVTLGIDF